MAFPNFHGRRGENAGNFLDDLEMAFLVSGREDEEIKLRAFPLVLREEAKVWFQDLDMGKQGNWEALKRAFLLRYSDDNNPEEIWRKLSKLQQVSPDSYLEYETQFLKLWTQWENNIPEGERAPNFLQKERFLAGLTPILREKVKCKFPGSFKEALTWARLKDRKLQFQRSWRDHSQAASRGALSSGERVAIKKLTIGGQHAKQEFLNEVNLITSVQHKNLIKLLGCCVEGSERILVYEYLPNKSLDLFLSATGNRILNWSTRYGVILGMAKGLAYLHEESHTRIIHRDIKPSNVLLDDELNPIIADFGLARLVRDNATHVNTGVAGTM
ncbi:hypothetical protein L7F22_016329 [Adiantum nelumboides]|nr:hypothetical protein [Adiantum nelumboides]